MNVKVETIDKHVTRLEIEVDATQFEAGMQKAYLKNIKSFKIPGFRAGKAPRNIVERYYGESVFYEEALNFICPTAYSEAVEQHNIDVVNEPSFDIVKIGAGQNLIFTATVTVKPEVVLAEYKGIEAKKIDVEVADEDVDKTLQKTAERNARIVESDDRIIQDGDIVNMDFRGTVDGVAFEGGTADGYELELGKGQFLEDFEKQLIGAAKDENRDVNLTFPSDYHAVDLAGKAAIFKVKINHIKVKEMPAIDDEFAMDVSEFGTLAEYKDNLKQELIKNKETDTKGQMRAEILEKIVEGSTVDIPSIMIDHRIDLLARRFASMSGLDQVSFNKFLEANKEMADSLKQRFAERAKKDVKTDLVIDAISKAEKIEVTEEEIMAEIKKYIAHGEEEVEEVMSRLSDEVIQEIGIELLKNKTKEFLYDNAKLV